MNLDFCVYPLTFSLCLGVVKALSRWPTQIFMVSEGTNEIQTMISIMLLVVLLSYYSAALFG